MSTMIFPLLRKSIFDDYFRFKKRAIKISVFDDRNQASQPCVAGLYKQLGLMILRKTD